MVCLLHIRGRALGVPQGGTTLFAASCCCMWWRVQQGTVPLAQLLARFESLPRYPQANWALPVLIPGWGNPHCWVVVLSVGEGLRGTNAACSALPHLQSLPPLSTSKLGPSGADSWVGGLVYILGPCGSLQRTLL